MNTEIVPGTRKIPCFRCDEPFIQHRRSPSHYCKPCRIIRHRESTRNRQREVREQAEAIVSRLPQEVSLDYVLYMASVAQNDGGSLSRDRQPEGTKSPRGSDDGRSTYFSDLAEELDIKCRESAVHSWWDENPHWAIDL